MKKYLPLLLLSGALFAGDINKADLDQLNQMVTEIGEMKGKFMDPALLTELKGNDPEVLKFDTIIAVQMGTFSNAVANLGRMCEETLKWEMGALKGLTYGHQATVAKTVIPYQRKLVIAVLVESINQIKPTWASHAKNVKNRKLDDMVMQWGRDLNAIQQLSVKWLQPD